MIAMSYKPQYTTIMSLAQIVSIETFATEYHMEDVFGCLAFQGGHTAYVRGFIVSHGTTK